ncbi:FKBP-type peptidyl-prolyl cis-trans isomerase [Ferrimonas lipolytica]|uniref:Peptidyl-prolyl cis-trans isomerase n=1 Tax=Ferrimonas lipolytica TaxID=2724191 RepID=A0A6H1UBE4_9GAMM|nr:FKBP-type peptidyl-prolyl cis-trans isomerase [Ferrimonas lipolytica]QIZ75683.1 FKBP-type peptidyl-prolyl cis-trans isomerase [Ferrimonas lipolytica]
MQTIFKVSLLTAAIALTGCQDGKTEEVAATAAPAAIQFETEEQKVAYAIGSSIGQNVVQNIETITAQQAEMDKPLDADLIRQGIKDTMAANTQMGEEQITEVLQKFQTDMQTAMQAKQEEMQKLAAEQAEAEKAEGPKWLAEVAKTEGAILTDSGLVLIQLRAADGAKPTAADTVEVHYRGTTRDGNQFDSSYDRGETIQFPLSGVIKGWTEGLQLMEVGSKYELYIPSELGYGARGAGADIPPHAALKFEIELVSIPSQAAAE